MPHATVSYMREACSLPGEESIPDEFLAIHLAIGENDVRDKLGSADYDLVINGADNTKKDLLRYSEACLAMVSAIPFINLQASANGGIKMSINTDNAGGAGSTTRNMNPKELKELSRQFERSAHKTIYSLKGTSTELFSTIMKAT